MKADSIQPGTYKVATTEGNKDELPAVRVDFDNGSTHIYVNFDMGVANGQLSFLVSDEDDDESFEVLED